MSFLYFFQSEKFKILPVPNKDNLQKLKRRSISKTLILNEKIIFGQLLLFSTTDICITPQSEMLCSLPIPTATEISENKFTEFDISCFQQFFWQSSVFLYINTCSVS